MTDRPGFTRSLAWLALLLAMGSAPGLPPPAHAGGSTAGSLVSREEAIRQATLWMPDTAQITSINCTEMVIDSSPRYVCTVQWGPGQP